jgi:transcriptional regulator with XRE-family HTH domain
LSNLGKYLKNLRKGKMAQIPLSIRAAAKGAEVNYQTLANYEEGNTERVDANVLKSLSDYYGVSLEDMCKHL